MTSSNLSYPEVVFSHSLEMEARRLLYLAAKLPHGVLQERGFMVLPYLPKQMDNAVIYFPDLNYDQIPDFWEQVNRLELMTPISAPAKLLKGMMDLIEPVYDVKHYGNSVHDFSREWGKIHSNFWYNLFALFPTYRHRLKSINVYITHYGPYSTFRLASTGRTVICIYLRDDATLEQLMWSILTCLFRPVMEDALRFSWEESQATIDFLMRESMLNCGRKYINPIMQGLRSEQIARLKQQSSRYIKKLNFSQAVQPWRREDNDIFYGEIRVDNLSLTERKLLDLLLSKQMKTVSYEQIIEKLWPDSENASDWAVSKQIERLRLKLSKLRISRRVIQADRGRGYTLI